MKVENLMETDEDGLKMRLVLVDTNLYLYFDFFLILCDGILLFYKNEIEIFLRNRGKIQRIPVVFTAFGN
jgi:hypothetical protein